MVLVAIAQGLLAQSFLGGPSQEIVDLYCKLSNRSAICSDRIVNVYGPNRFKVDEKGYISPDGSLFQTLHNSPKQAIGPDPNAPVKPKTAPEVDSIKTTFYPPYIVGLDRVELIKLLAERMSNSSNLDMQIFPETKAIMSSGSDCIKNLPNRGFSKPINFPSLMGELWFCTRLTYCSELDFLTAVAQIADCKLEANTTAYTFVPDIEKIRTRCLKTYQMFGTDGTDLYNLQQRLRYDAIEKASPEIIKQSISDSQMYLALPLPQDSKIRQDCLNVKAAAIAKLQAGKDENGKKILASIKEKGNISIVYRYSFYVGILVELQDGKNWLI